MGNLRARYTREFMIEAVRMVRSGLSMAAVAKNWVSLHNWGKADAAGQLNGAGNQSANLRDARDAMSYDDMVAPSSCGTELLQRHLMRDVVETTLPLELRLTNDCNRYV